MSGGHSLVAVCGLVTAVASPAVQHGPQARRPQQLWHTGSAVAVPGFQLQASVVVVHEFSYPAGRGIFLG